MPTPPRILLVRFSSMGDILLTSALVRALRARHPDAHIAFLIKAQFAPLVSESPRLTEVLTYRDGDPLLPLARELRARKFTHLMDLHGSLRSRALHWLVPGRWREYSKRRVAREILIRLKKNVYRDTTPEAERFFDAADGLDVRPDGKGLEFYVSDAARAKVDAWLAAKGLAARHFTLLGPGAAHFSKRWPPEYWTELAARLARSGKAIVVTGGRAEREVGDAITAAARAANRDIVAENSAGEFALQETGALLQRADALAVGDTGVMHMATAVGTPIVTMMGPTVGPFGFYPYRANATVLERDLYCRPCTPFGGPTCPEGHHRCLRDIAPAEVEQALVQLHR
ncbi:MAG TPA: glycosyltransferase family 9 protein [Gemmatimonadales bacterium]|nr:glycosyltransferase family 9 protein [Gemmatimonadales bacterium]